MDERHWRYIPWDDIYLFNTGNAQKAWLCYGCRWIPELSEYRFIVWAPNAAGVALVGDFNDWQPWQMEHLDGGIWAIFAGNAWGGQKYKYQIQHADGSVVYKSDPFAAWSQCRSETASLVWDGGHYQWKDGKYLNRRKRWDFLNAPMSIYEVHLGSWKDPYGGYNYRAIADELSSYCLDMGYTHVELMPITEYPFDGSWGYQVTGFYAPTSRYGNPDDFRYFVDCMHQAGIGVIIDWVPAHFPRDEHGLRLFDGTPQFECKEQRMAEHPDWGTMIFDYASPQVQSFLVSSAALFCEEYHVDGIRVDAVSSMLYLNYGRKEGEFTPNRDGGTLNLDAIDFLRKMNNTIHSAYPGVVTIAEESTAFPLVSAPPEEGGLGFSMKWDMGFMHDTLDYMKLDPYFRSWNHNKITFSMIYAFSENFVLAYSHDEVVHGKCSMINKMPGNYEEKFASLRVLYGFQFAHPGKKLTFMGSEFGQFIEWNWQQPLDWLLLEYPKHGQLRDYMRELNRLYCEHGAFYRQDHSWDGFQWLNVDDAGRSSVAFLRSPDHNHGKRFVCVFNFTPVTYEHFVFGMPAHGYLNEFLNSDDTRFGGSGIHNIGTIHTKREAFNDFPYSASVTLPGLSAVYFEFTSH